MSITDNAGHLPTTDAALPGARDAIARFGGNVHTPLVLSVTVAMLEAGALALVFMFTALIYHFAVLDLAPEHFSWSIYFVFGALLTLGYAAFSTIAARRFLEGDHQNASAPGPALFAWTSTYGAALLCAFLAGEIGYLSRVSLTTAFILGLPAALAMRGLTQAILSERIAEGALRFQNVAVIGPHRDVVQFLLNGDLWRHGQTVSGALYLDAPPRDAHNGPPSNVSEKDVIAFARDCAEKGVETVIMVGALDEFQMLQRVIDPLKRFALDIVYAPAHENRPLQFIDIKRLGATKTLRFSKKPLSEMDLFLKRAFDIAGATFGLLLLSPVIALTALAIKAESHGPVIFRQKRKGFNGRDFFIYKFRSMTVTEPGDRMRQAVHNDARITRVGALIRRTSIDELPQLINVLKGDMSLVGPRPHALSHDDELSRQVERYAFRQRIKPGITGWAQVNGYRGETRTSEQIEGRTQRDLYYVDNWSVLFDLRIIALTLFSSTTRQNAY